MPICKCPYANAHMQMPIRKCPNCQMPKLSNAQSCTQMPIYANAHTQMPICKCPYANAHMQMPKLSNAQIVKCPNCQMPKAVRKCPYANAHTQMPICKCPYANANAHMQMPICKSPYSCMQMPICKCPTPFACENGYLKMYSCKWVRPYCRTLVLLVGLVQSIETCCWARRTAVLLVLVRVRVQLYYGYYM
jgi:hypothetical protein